jgi:hypothetical protein
MRIISKKCVCSVCAAAIGGSSTCHEFGAGLLGEPLLQTGDDRSGARTTPERTIAVESGHRETAQPVVEGENHVAAGVVSHLSAGRSSRAASPRNAFHEVPGALSGMPGWHSWIHRSSKRGLPGPASRSLTPKPKTPGGDVHSGKAQPDEAGVSSEKLQLDGQRAGLIGG